MREAGLAVRVRDEELPPTREELQGFAADFPVLVTLLTDPVDESVLCRGVKLVAQHAVGYDNIDLIAATRHRVAVTNTPGVLTQATAELTWALILAVTRKIVQADSFTRQGRFRAWDAMGFLGMELAGKTLGIVGAGRIGSRVGHTGACMGMRVLYHDLGDCESLDEAGGRRVGLPELLRESDVVSVHLPLNDSTRGMFSCQMIRKMKVGAFLVNTSRGPVVDEEALVTALREGRLAGAGLDVYEREPEIHPGLLEMDNVVLLPHIGSATREARGAMSRAVAENVIAFMKGQKPLNILNPEVLT